MSNSSWFFASLVAALVAISACGKKGDAAPAGGGKPSARAFPVEVAEVWVRKVDYTVGGVGTIAAFEEVQVTARVAGVVEKVSFAEGDTVAIGALLVEVEPARFGLALRTARAALERARAVAASARAQYERRVAGEQATPGLISGDELESLRTQAEVAAAEVSAQQVAVDKASLDLRDARVRAPIAGQLQTRSVKTGQYVQPGTVLATLVRRDPLLLRFSVPEGDAGRLVVGGKVTFSTDAVATPYVARITLVAAVADPTTRMVQVTAEIDDPRGGELRPGAFAQVSAPIGEQPAAVLIPMVAVRPSERGFLAYAVDGEVARERVIELGMRTTDGLVEVRRGLAAGERIVVRGAEALRDGVKVKVGDGGGKPSGGVDKASGGVGKPSGGVAEPAPPAQPVPAPGASRP